MTAAVEVAPLPRVWGLWLAFAPTTSPDAARRRFAQRYGIEPEQVVPAGAVLLAGPIPGQENRPLSCDASPNRA